MDDCSLPEVAGGPTADEGARQAGGGLLLPLAGGAAGPGHKTTKRWPGTSMMADRLFSMSEATAMPVEPRTPSAEQLAQWRALVERIRQGDRSQAMAWAHGAAAQSVGVHQVLITRRVPAAARCSAPAGRLGR